jgi:hypothetical protein
VEHVPDRKQVAKIWGDVEGTNTFLFIPGNGKTRVTYLQNATLISPGMTRGELNALVKARKEQVEQQLQKAKAILEK